MAVEFLSRCLELDPSRRISADEALETDFLRMGLKEEELEVDEEETVEVEGTMGEGSNADEMDILKV